MMNKISDTKIRDFLPKYRSNLLPEKFNIILKLPIQREANYILKEEPVVIRFKGGVPAFILIPHILFMFLAMLFSTLAGLNESYKISII